MGSATAFYPLIMEIMNDSSDCQHKKRLPCHLRTYAVVNEERNVTLIHDACIVAAVAAKKKPVKNEI